MNFYYLIPLIYLASAIVLFLIAGIILKENVKSHQNRAASAMLFFAGIAPLLISIYKTLILETGQLSPSTVGIFYIWEMFFPFLLWFSVLFPEPLPFYSRHKRLIQLAFIPHIFHIIIALALNDPDKVVRALEFDTSVPVLGLFIGFFSTILKLIATLLGFLYSIHNRFFSLINFTYVILAIYFLAKGYKQIINPALKAQVKVVIAGIAAAMSIYIIGVIIPTILSLRISHTVQEIMVLTALIIGPGSIAWAIIKYRFLDIGLIARQSLVYTLTTAIVVGGYILVISQLSDLFFSVFGFQSQILDIIVVVLMLLFFQPIYTQVDDFVRRIFIRSRSDYRHVMEELSRQLVTAFDTIRLATIIGDTLNREMFIERTYFSLCQENSGNFKIVGDSREYSLERDINDLLLEKGNPIFVETVRKMVKRGSLIEYFIESNCKILIPLVDKARLVGIIAIPPKVANYRYTYEDISLFSVLANQVVVSLNNAHLYAESLEKQRLEEELAVARQIQLNLLPKSVPVHDNYEFAAFNHPSRQVGGDYYDFLKSANGNTCVIVADVSGKGVGAALLVARLQAVLQSEGQRGQPIHTMIAGINDFLAYSTTADKFVTMFYGELDCSSGCFNFCNAGHNYPFVIRKNRSVEYLIEGGLLLGAFPGSPYCHSQLDLNKGDVLIIYTDGLTEALNDKGEEFGEKRLVETVMEASSKSAQFICGHMIRSVRQYAAANEEVDDMTVVVIKGK